VLDKGQHARTLRYQLRPFTLVGATTRAGLLSSPLRERFGIFHHLDFFSDEELTLVVQRSASILHVSIEHAAAQEIARRSRGTPRIANRLLRRVRDYAEVKADGVIALDIAKAALEFEGVDHRGLDGLDRELLRTLIQVYGGGPAGVETLAASLHEDTETLEEVVEPFLLKAGLIARTSAGRRATASAYAHLGLVPPDPPRSQGSLWPT
jgi:Holliday junction DNA helicase RuvB